MEARLNVAVVGLGWWGKVIIETLKESGKLRVVKTVDLNPEAGEWARSRDLAFTTDFGSAVDDPALDAVILCTPHSAHRQQVSGGGRFQDHDFLCLIALSQVRPRPGRAASEPGPALGGHQLHSSTGWT